MLQRGSGRAGVGRCPGQIVDVRQTFWTCMLAVPASAHANVKCRFSRKMLSVPAGFRVDRAGLFSFYGKTDPPPPAGQPSTKGKVQPPRLLSRGQSQEHPVSTVAPKNDAGTDT